jgi:hypothetical protein
MNEHLIFCCDPARRDLLREIKRIELTDQMDRQANRIIRLAPEVFPAVVSRDALRGPFCAGEFHAIPNLDPEGGQGFFRMALSDGGNFGLAFGA